MKNKIAAFILFFFCRIPCQAQNTNAKQVNTNTKGSTNIIMNVRKQLSALGVGWSYDEFVRYLYAKDTLVTSLFVKGGMQLNRTEFIPYVLNYFSSATADLLINYNAINENSCYVTLDVKFSDLFENLKAYPKKQALLKNICTQKEISKLDYYIQQEKATIVKYEKLKTEPEPNSCLTSFGNDIHIPLEKLMDKYYDEAVTFDILGPTTYTSKQVVLSKLNIALVAGKEEALSDPILFLKNAVKEACPEFYIILETDPYYLNLLQSAKKIILQNISIK